MPSSYALIDDDGYGRTTGGLVVREDCPGECCDQEPQLFWKLTPCACTPNGSNRFWTDSYAPSMGCVWAEINDKCYYICPDSASKETLGQLDILQRPALNPAADAQEACNACCTGGVADQCCDLNSLGCGLTRDAYPLVTLSLQTTASLTLEKWAGCEQDEYACALYTYQWTQPASTLSTNPVGQSCWDSFYAASDTLQEMRRFPCDDQDSAFDNELLLRGSYSLDDGQTRAAPHPVGYNDGREAVYGTATVLTGVVLIGFVRYTAGFFGHGGYVDLEVAVSKTTGDWWCAVSGLSMDNNAVGGDQLSASLSVSSPAGCSPIVTVGFDVDYSELNDGRNCLNNEPKRVHTRCAGTATFTFAGIGGCEGARPEGDGFVDGGAGDPANAAAIEQANGANPMHRCRGCGG